MALLEKYFNNFTVLLKRLFRKYKLLHTSRYRMLTLVDTDRDVQLYNFIAITRSQPNSYNNLPVPAIRNDWDECINRSFFNFSPDTKSKKFMGRKLVGFSREEMFDVINDVDSYKDFLPFCKRSKILFKKNEFMKADLIIGFPPVVEKYTSHITYYRPDIIMAQSRDATLFDHLVTNWKFSPGLSKNPRTCVVYFYVSFEFKSLFHSQLANMFFNELVKQMEGAFYSEAVRRYGKPSIPPIKLKVVNDTPPPQSNPSSAS